MVELKNKKHYLEIHFCFVTKTVYHKSEVLATTIYIVCEKNKYMMWRSINGYC